MRGYASTSDREQSISVPVSTGLGAALFPITAQFRPQYGYPSASDLAQNIRTPVSTKLGAFGCCGALPCKPSTGLKLLSGCSGYGCMGQLGANWSFWNTEPDDLGTDEEGTDPSGSDPYLDAISWDLGTDEDPNIPISPDGVVGVTDTTDWLNVLQKSIGTVAGTLVPVANAYSVYQQSGGGSAGFQTAVLAVLGKNSTAQQQAILKAELAKQAKAAATPWYSNPAYIIGGVAIVGLAAVAILK